MFYAFKGLLQPFSSCIWIYIKSVNYGFWSNIFYVWSRFAFSFCSFLSPLLSASILILHIHEFVELYLSVNKMNDNNNDNNNNNNESSEASKEKWKATAVRNQTIPSLLKILKDMLYNRITRKKEEMHKTHNITTNTER